MMPRTPFRRRPPPPSASTPKPLLFFSNDSRTVLVTSRAGAVGSLRWLESQRQWRATVTAPGNPRPDAVSHFADIARAKEWLEQEMREP